MKTFSVYQLTRAGAIENILLIKEGFSFVAFLMSPLWSLYNRLWQVFAVYAIALLIIYQLFQFNIIDFTQSSLFMLTLHIYMGYVGNYFLQKRLTHMKYELIQIIAGRDKDEALLRLLDRYDITASQ
jgi:hypothetical protein